MSPGQMAGIHQRFSEMIGSILPNGSEPFRLFRWYLRRNTGRRRPGRVAALVINRMNDQFRKCLPLKLGEYLPKLAFDSVVVRKRRDKWVTGEATLKPLEWEVECVLKVDGVERYNVKVPFALEAKGEVRGRWIGDGEHGERVILKRFLIKVALSAENNYVPFLAKKIKLKERKFQLIDRPIELRREDGIVVVVDSKT